MRSMQRIVSAVLALKSILCMGNFILINLLKCFRKSFIFSIGVK